MTPSIDVRSEWLETDGLGGFASGSADTINRRRYHGLLVSQSPGGGERFMYVNGVEVTAHERARAVPLSSHCYGDGVVHPAGASLIRSFTTDPWPTWTYELPGGTIIEHTRFMPRGRGAVVLSWRVVAGPRDVILTVRPLLSVRDYHALHHRNEGFNFNPIEVECERLRITWRPYADRAAVAAACNGAYRHEPLWFDHFRYDAELDRGFPGHEDLASPGTFTFDLETGAARLAFALDGALPEDDFDTLEKREKNRRKPLDTLARAAEAYLVKQNDRHTIIAGYPWFGAWGRDTFIALRGLCLATGRLAEARHILLSWAEHVRGGLLPNRFPDYGDTPEYNSIDASLWYVICVHEFLDAVEHTGYDLLPAEHDTLTHAVEAILDGLVRGTIHGIRADEDGLLACGQPGVQLTWMDAKIGDWVVTPRIGKPVEVQALWLNALCLASKWNDKWNRLCALGCATFRARFWNAGSNCLFDVIDNNHRRFADDASIRPNMVFAVGGLPMMLLGADQAWAVVNRIEKELLTPTGLRSLSPLDPAYVPRYEGNPFERDAAYHQGTVWPWLIGAFVEAWVRVRGSTDAAKIEARKRFVEPMLKHLSVAGLGHVSEIADAEAPHTPRGCPFQAWSVGELLRLDRQVLALRAELVGVEAGKR